MKTLNLKWPLRVEYKPSELWLLLGVLVLLFTAGQNIIEITDPGVGLPNRATWLFMLQGLIAFMVLMPLTWWLLNHFWMVLGLPSANGLIKDFIKLERWQQLKFYFASFALLLLAAVGCLIAIC